MSKFTTSKKKLAIVGLAFILLVSNYICKVCLYQIISFWVFLGLVIVIMRFDFFHPMVWYNAALTIYSTAYPILYYLDVRTNRGYTSEPLLLTSVAILTFVSVMSADHNEGTLIEVDRAYSGLNEFLLHFLTFFTFGAAVAIKFLGFSGKKDIYASSSFFTIVLSGVLIFIYLYVLNICDKLSNNEKIKKLTLLEVFLSILAIALITGERDFIMRFLLMMILTLYYFGKISKRTLLFLLAGFIVLIPLSWQYKYYFSTGLITVRSYDNGISSILINFLSGEFESASRNLQMLVNNCSITKGIMHGKTWISDVTRVVGYGPYSPVRWFQNTFYAQSSTGQGFTIIGEGYINFGYLGVVFEFIIIGIMLRKLYYGYRKNIYTLFFYIGSIPLFIYATRADLSNIFSPFFRHILLSAGLYYLLKNKVVWNK